ncbi:SpoIIE family protein phosphatase [Streptomyces cocklensis]|uniref:GAF domain-containing protein n=1 Tax=Actinacidiphila cocklensis TaxID=887465 RepID=A0A9W4DYX7_9ACTN|nr:SpoIIE family protein phosphatase [Actinacidiphila cocklensis]MDD1062768.1 SpoIIE family protein phosphatase [Actinacidiphila cocklensis]CAG6396046.1 GAF domain-containing protein [Actinacidiphila cocklensis]
MAAVHGAPDDGPADAVRLRLLEAADGLNEADLLRLALQQAVSALGGYGGLAHLRGPEDGTMRLAAVNGLPAPLARRWDNLPTTGFTAPCGAVKDLRVTWDLRWPAAAAAGADGTAAGRDGAGAGGDQASAADAAVPGAGWIAGPPPPVQPSAWAVTDTDGRLPGGVVAAPLLLNGEPVGALSVLTGAAPDSGRQRFLARLAGAVSSQLPRSRAWRSGTSPWWQEPMGTKEQAMQQVSVGTWTWDLDSGRLDVDEVTEGLATAAGLDPATWDHRIETWMERIHPDDRPGVQESIEASLSTGQPYAVEHRVLDGDGRISWLELRAAPERDDTGRPVRMVGTTWNVTARRSKLAWLVGLLEMHPDPIHVLSADDRVEWANHAARALGGGAGAEMIGEVPWVKQPKLAGQGMPEMLTRARAAPGAAVTSELTYYEEPGGRLASWTVRAVEVGGFVATQMADISEQKAAERAEAERSRRMTELNQALIRAVGTPDVVAAIIEHVLPLVSAEGLIVQDVTGPAPRLVAATGYAAEFRAELEAPGWPQRLATAADTATPRFFSSIAELDALWPRLTPLARYGGKGAWAVLPLIVGDHRVGSCIISWPGPRDFTEQEKTLLGTVGVIIAQALGKAKLYEEARRRAERLQNELLPGELPDTVAVDSASRYRLAAGEEVGGDWYDTIPMPGGRTLAVIGDVKGHGLEQAIAMGIIRHAVLTVAALDLPVDEIMAHLNDVAGRLEPLTATSLLLLYDPTTGCCRIAGAGHPPPIVVRPGGKAQEVDLPVGQPLGQAQVPAPVTEHVLPEGSVLVLYSDGLLEGAERDRDPAPLADLLTRYSATAPLPSDVGRREAWLDTLCDTITGQLPPDPHRKDDAVLLALALGRVPDDRIASWDLPCAPESARRGRVLAAERLTAWDLGDLKDTATLVVSELIGNAVRHAVGIGRDVADGVEGLLRLRLLRLTDDSVTCEVYDGSQATPRVRHPLLDDEFGRGLQLVAVTAKRWGTRYTEGGKCIWARVAL